VLNKKIFFLRFVQYIYLLGQCPCGSAIFCWNGTHADPHTHNF